MAESKSTNELAFERNELAYGRTLMALERTLMAWIRTALSLIGFGFTIFKFLESIVQKEGSHLPPVAPRNLGLFLIFLGLGLLVSAMYQYIQMIRILRAYSEQKPLLSLSVLAAIGVFIAGVFALFDILFGIGG